MRVCGVECVYDDFLKGFVGSMPDTRLSEYEFELIFVEWELNVRNYYSVFYV